MPFDKHLGASGARQLELARAVTKKYVPRESEPARFEVLDPQRQATLEAWVDTLIPSEGPWPSAAERGVAEYIDNDSSASGMLRRMLVEVVDDLEGLADSDGNGDFASAALDRRIELLPALRVPPIPPSSPSCSSSPSRPTTATALSPTSSKGRPASASPGRSPAFPPKSSTSRGWTGSGRVPRCMRRWSGERGEQQL